MTQYILLEENMANENEKVIFSVDVPYQIFTHDAHVPYIENEDNILIDVPDIWVEYKEIDEVEAKSRLVKV